MGFAIVLGFMVFIITTIILIIIFGKYCISDLGLLVLLTVLGIIGGLLSAIIYFHTSIIQIKPSDYTITNYSIDFQNWTASYTAVFNEKRELIIINNSDPSEYYDARYFKIVSHGKDVVLEFKTVDIPSTFWHSGLKEKQIKIYIPVNILNNWQSQ
jgi:hypothetical protein